jgi:DNA-binding transcriptional MerR regulator
MASAGAKDAGALLTIGELSQELGVPQHILRYWETRFPQLRPMQRAGNRRYYRTADVALAHKIHRLLSEEGYTVRGVQKLLRGKSEDDQQVTAMPIGPAVRDPQPEVSAEPLRADNGVEQHDNASSGVDVFRLIALRDQLVAALEL